MSHSPLVIAMLTALASTVGAQTITMKSPPAVRRDVAAFPRIAAPADDAQRRINRALDRLDLKMREAARDCLSGGGTHRGNWERQVDVTMRGPEFVSYLVTDEVDCGGAHPNEGHSAIVYDLKSGLPVDWTALLPASLTGKLALTGGEDGVQVVTLASPRLFALYRGGYDQGPAENEDEKDCRETIAGQAEDGPVPMLAWLDAAGGGLALQFDLPHVSQNCSEAIVIPVATLRREGASPRLVSAIVAAHAAIKPKHARSHTGRSG